MEKDLSQLFEEFKNEARFSRRLRPATIKGYVDTFELFRKLMPEITRPEEISGGACDAFFKRLDERPRIVGKGEIRQGVKASTIKTYWMKLNTFLDWLEAKKFILKNPLRDKKPPRVSYDDFRRMKDEQIDKIMASIVLHSTDSFLLRRDTLIVELLLYCGLRRGELISLKVTDIDLIKSRITINGETSKSKHSRTLPLGPKLSLHIKDYLKERNGRKLTTEYLLASCREDKRLTDHGLKHWVKGLIKKSSVKFHLHRFRHTFACRLVEKNVNAFSIQYLMGHRSILMTMKYIRSIMTENMTEEIDKISY